MLIDDVLEDLRAEKISIDAALGEIRRRVSESDKALELPTLYDRVDQSQQKGLTPSHARQIRLCLDGAISAMEHRYQGEEAEDDDDWGDDELELSLEPLEPKRSDQDDADEDVAESQAPEDNQEADLEDGLEDDPEDDDDSGLELPRIDSGQKKDKKPETPPPPAKEPPPSPPPADQQTKSEAKDDHSSAQEDQAPSGDDHEVILETRSSIPSSRERFGPEADDQVFQTTMVGALLGGRFELLNRVSQDPYGTVYRGRDHESKSSDTEEQLCAIRVLPSKLAKQDAVVKRVEAVIRRTRKIQHPKLLTQRELYRDGDQAWIVSPLPPGTILARFIRRECVKGLPADRALSIAREIGEGLHVAHQQDMAHGDLKPASIFIADNDQIIIADFGLRIAMYGKKAPSAQAGSTEIEQMDPIDAYLTVEALEGNPPHPSDDIYALACVTATLLVGGHPFNGQSGLRRLEKDISPPRMRGLTGNQNKVLRQGMAIYQNDRPQSVMEFLAELETRRGELPKKEIGIAAGVVLALAAGWIPLQSWLDHRDQQAQVAELRDTPWPELRGELRLVDEEILAAMQDRQRTELAQRFADAVEDELQTGSPMQARTLLDEGREYFPQSESLEALREPVAEARGRVEAEAATRLSTRLENDALEAREDGTGVPSLVAQLDEVAPGHELTDRDALRVQYISVLRETARSPDLERARGLEAAVTALFPDDEELMGLAQQALGQTEAQRAQRAIQEIVPRLEPQLPPADFSELTALSEDWVELVRMTGSHSLIGEHQAALAEILERELDQLMARADWAGANDFLRSQSALWASDSLRDQRRRLTRAQLADGFRPDSLRAERRGLSDRRERVEALLAEARMSPVWSGELVIAWRDMVAWMRPGRDWLSDLREEIAETYTEAIQLARENGDMERARDLAREGLMIIPDNRSLTAQSDNAE